MVSAFGVHSWRPFDKGAWRPPQGIEPGASRILNTANSVPNHWASIRQPNHWANILPAAVTLNDWPDFALVLIPFVYYCREILLVLKLSLNGWRVLQSLSINSFLSSWYITRTCGTKNRVAGYPISLSPYRIHQRDRFGHRQVWSAALRRTSKSTFDTNLEE